jgi:hypothetical protein
MAGLDPAIPLIEAQPCHTIGIAGSSPAMTAVGLRLMLSNSVAPERNLGESELELTPPMPHAIMVTERNELGGEINDL